MDGSKAAVVWFGGQMEQQGDGAASLRVMFGVTERHLTAFLLFLSILPVGKRWHQPGCGDDGGSSETVATL